MARDNAKTKRDDYGDRKFVPLFANAMIFGTSNIPAWDTCLAAADTAGQDRCFLTRYRSAYPTFLNITSLTISTPRKEVNIFELARSSLVSAPIAWPTTTSQGFLHPTIAHTS